MGGWSFVPRARNLSSERMAIELTRRTETRRIVRERDDFAWYKIRIGNGGYTVDEVSKSEEHHLGCGSW